MTTEAVPDASVAVLHARVTEQLGAEVVDGVWPAGRAVSMESLEARFGISRTVVREVVRTLAAHGLVRSRRRVGVVACSCEHWQVYDPDVIRWRLAGRDRARQLRSISELRRGIEPQAAALAAVRASDEDVDEMVAAALGMQRTGARGDLEAYLAHDVAFHTALLRASGNEMMTALSPVVAGVLAGRTHHHLMPAHPEPEAIRLHAVVASAVASGDAATAREAMTDIVREAAAAVERLVGPDPEPLLD